MSVSVQLTAWDNGRREEEPLVSCLRSPAQAAGLTFMYQSLKYFRKHWCLIKNYTHEFTIILTALIWHSSKTIFVKRQTRQMVGGICCKQESLLWASKANLRREKELISLYAEANLILSYPHILLYSWVISIIIQTMVIWNLHPLK